jgi:hypothetical protein
VAGEDIERLAREAADRVREVVSGAEERAQEIIEQAKAEAERIRARAEDEARERVDQARRALDQIEARLGSPAAPQPPTQHEPPPSPPPPEPPAPEEPVTPPEGHAVQPPPPPPPVVTSSAHESHDAFSHQPHAAHGHGGAAPAPAGTDLTAVRLVAMKLALDGTPRDEARRQLAAEYQVADLDGLLADVYEKAAR